VRRFAIGVLCVLLGADVGLLAWSMWRMADIIRAPDDFIPGIVNDRLLAVMAVAIGATYLAASVLGVVDIVVLRRLPARRVTWFVLAVLATLLGLPDVVLVMLAGRALLLPDSLIFLMLAPAGTFVAVISTAATGLPRPHLE
jgi:hypothetical protein